MSLDRDPSSDPPISLSYDELALLFEQWCQGRPTSIHDPRIAELVEALAQQAREEGMVEPDLIRHHPAASIENRLLGRG